MNYLSKTVVNKLRKLTLDISDRTFNISVKYNLDYMRCLIVITAALTQSIIKAGMEEDLNRMIHLGDDKNE